MTLVHVENRDAIESRRSFAFPMLVGAIFCIAVVVQNATTIAVPSNTVELGEKGLATPIGYGWPMPFVVGQMAEPVSFGSPVRYWRSTRIDSVRFLPLIFNAVIGAALVYATIRVSSTILSRIRPRVTLAGLFGFTMFVAFYIAHVLEFDFKDVESEPWRLKIPIRAVSIRLIDRVFRILEGATWLAVLVACIYFPTAISSHLAARRSKDRG